MTPALDPTLQRLAAGSAIPEFWQRLAERSARVEGFVGSRAVKPGELAQGHLTWLGTVLKGLGKGAEHERVVAMAMHELKQSARTLDAREQWELYARLRRALDPRAALDTWEDSVFFSDEERALLAGLTGSPAATPYAPDYAPDKADSKKLKLLQWAQDKGADYRGYVCIIVKVTRHCNLRCTYCHDWREGKDARMSFDVLAHTMHKTLATPDHRLIDVVWHGGEPTLIGRRGALRILALQRRFSRNGQTVRNILQSNGAALDEAWAQFFVDFGFVVNVSLDGPPEIHEHTRPQADGAPTYSKAMRGLSLLREKGLASGVLMVVGDELVAYGAERLVKFMQATGLSEVGLLPVRPANPPTASSAPYLHPQRYARFLVEVHRARLAHPTPWIQVREIDMIMSAHGGTMPTHCEMLGNCVGTYFSVEPNGDVAHCDKYVGDAEYTLGNLLRDDFASIRASAKVQTLREQAQSTEDACQSCKHFSRCRGWCPHERYVAKRMGLGRSATCCGLGPLFDALDELTPERAAE